MKLLIRRLSAFPQWSLIISVAFILLACAVRANARPKLDSADPSYSLTVGGRTRTYEVHIPSSYSKDRLNAAVIVLHGGGGSGAGVRSVSQMDRVSEQAGFLVVYPNAYGRSVLGKTFGSWNAGRCCPPAMEENIDDVSFISQVVDRLLVDFRVDPKRVYVTGISNGSQMALRLSCQLSEKIAAIMAVAGQEVFDNCHPSRPVPILYIHGTADPCSVYDGGLTGGCFHEGLRKWIGFSPEPYRWQVDSAPSFVEKIIKRNGLSGLGENVYQHGAASCQSWGRKTSREVVFCKVTGMGHVWPGGGVGVLCDQRPNSRACQLFLETVGPRSNDLDASLMGWNFFKEHPKP